VVAAAAGVDNPSVARIRQTARVAITENRAPSDGTRAASRRRFRLRMAPELIRTVGVRGVVARVLGHTVYRRVIVAGADMNREYMQPPCDVELTIRRLTVDEVGAYAAFAPNSDAKTVERRLAAGSRIYAAWSEGRIVSAGWLDVEQALFDAVGARVPIREKVVYARGAYTVPELRGRNIATVLYVTALRLLRDEGFERAVGFVLPESRSSIGPVDKAGFERLGSLGWLGLWQFRVYFYKPIGGKVGLMPRRRRGRKPVDLDLDVM
jgi:hypothetical protein